jgi:ectoine hydroxylase-related dioxygenase (phytanoyl-CoA dioxygenase family)
MTNEENYCFDVGGYLVIPGALDAEALHRLNAALENRGRFDDQKRFDGMLSWDGPDCEPFRDLLVHPVLVNYLNQICGSGFRLEQLPRLLTDDPAAGLSFDEPLVGGDEPRDPSRGYYHQNQRRQCQLVRAIWALADVDAGDGGLVFVQASHKSNTEAPAGLLDGTRDLGLIRQVTLRAGDLLLLADTTIHGLQPWTGHGPMRLLDYGFSARGVILEAGSGAGSASVAQPAWQLQLDPAQRAVLDLPGHADTTPPRTLITTEHGCQISDTRDVIHPSLLTKNHDSGIDPEEFFFWDLCGHLVVRDIMTAEDLALANEAIDRFSSDIVVGEELARGSTSLAGSGRPTLGRLLELPHPWCEPFRRMIAHPAIVQRLTWMGGSGFRCGQPTAFCAVQGSSGHALHDANEPLNPSRSYVYKNGRSFCEAVTVTWQLRDVAAEDGGFACAPGSHKAQYPMPAGVRSCDDDMGLVTHPTFQAGDVLFFMDGAQTHGALAWHSEIARRSVLIKYSSRNFNRSGGDLAHPESRWGEIVRGMTDAQLAVMRGPDRDNHNGNVPRLDVAEDGDVRVCYERTGGLYSGATPDRPLV